LRPLATGVSWVAPANLHLTLKFLGDVEEARMETISTALAAAAARAAAFEMVVRGLGAFPSATRPRVIWAGVAADPASLPSIARAVEEMLGAAGFPAEARPFAGHVTLGRVRVPRRDPALGQMLTGAEGEVFGAFRVERVSLMRSDRSPRGSRYTELAGLPLAQPGPRQS
jgi:2'-5' RNA ligase